MNKMITLKLDVTLTADHISKYVKQAKGEYYVEWGSRQYPIEAYDLESDMHSVTHGIEPKLYAEMLVDVPVKAMTFRMVVKDCSVEDNGSVEVGGFELEDISTNEIPEFPFDWDFEIFNNDDVWSELYSYVKNKRYI